MFSVSLRWAERDQFWKRGSVSPFGATAGTLAPLAMVGLMNGGCVMFWAGNPASRKRAGKGRLVGSGGGGWDANPRFGSPVTGEKPPPAYSIPSPPRTVVFSLRR